SDRDRRTRAVATPRKTATRHQPTQAMTTQDPRKIRKRKIEPLGGNKKTHHLLCSRMQTIWRTRTRRKTERQAPECAGRFSVNKTRLGQKDPERSVRQVPAPLETLTTHSVNNRKGLNHIPWLHRPIRADLSVRSCNALTKTAAGHAGGTTHKASATM